MSKSVLTALRLIFWAVCCFAPLFALLRWLPPPANGPFASTPLVPGGQSVSLGVLMECKEPTRTVVQLLLRDAPGDQLPPVGDRFAVRVVSRYRPVPVSREALHFAPEPGDQRLNLGEFVAEPNRTYWVELIPLTSYQPLHGTLHLGIARSQPAAITGMTRSEQISLFTLLCGVTVPIGAILFARRLLMESGKGKGSFTP